MKMEKLTSFLLIRFKDIFQYLRQMTLWTLIGESLGQIQLEMTNKIHALRAARVSQQQQELFCRS